MAKAKKKAKANISAEELQKYYREMLLIRRFRRKSWAIIWHGSDRRILSPLYWTRSCCCWT
jgi:TPP-dependent pyruvate/acetoin dehydrogenase alpha subunit